MNVLSWSILPCSSCLPEVRSLAFFLTARHTIRSRLFGCSLTPRINTIPIYPISTPGRDNMSIVGFRENKYKKKNTESWLQRAPALQRWRAERGSNASPFRATLILALVRERGGRGDDRGSTVVRGETALVVVVVMLVFIHHRPCPSQIQIRAGPCSPRNNSTTVHSRVSIQPRPEGASGPRM